jgi:hypothetical protein
MLVEELEPIVMEELMEIRGEAPDLFLFHVDPAVDAEDMDQLMKEGVFLMLTGHPVIEVDPLAHPSDLAVALTVGGKVLLTDDLPRLPEDLEGIRHSH